MKKKEKPCSRGFKFLVNKELPLPIQTMKDQFSSLPKEIKQAILNSFPEKNDKQSDNWCSNEYITLMMFGFSIEDIRVSGEIHIQNGDIKILGQVRADSKKEMLHAKRITKQIICKKLRQTFPK